MADCSFQIDLAMPAVMTAQVQQDIVTAIRPRWHVTGIEMQRLEDSVFRLRLLIRSEADVAEAVSTDELREFRNLVVSLVAFSAMVPVRLRSHGIFDFPDDGKKRRQTSLGAMDYEFSPAPLSDLRPLVLGLALEPKYASALHFFWEALNSEQPLYRFINLAVAIELLVRHDSPVCGSRHPICGDPNCGYQLERCPKCDRSWKIPSTLRERAAFLLSAELLSEFIAARNRVFHGLSDKLHHDYSKNLLELNNSLLVIIRNYLGKQMGLPEISRQQLPLALNPPDARMTIFYSLP